MSHDQKKKGHGGGTHHLPWYKHVAAGGLAGLVEVLIMYPLDVVKTRLQLAHGKASLIGVCKDIIKNEGIFNLYRGIISPVLGEVPKRALKFASNEQYKALLQKRRKPGEALSQLDIVIAGAGAGATEALANCPFELVKVRMQSKENLGLYSSTADAARKIVAQEGPLALYKGLESQLWRNGSWNATYFGVINFVKNLIPVGSVSDTQRNFVAGLVAGTAACTVNNPFDVVKSRVQNTLPGQVARYNWAWPALFQIAREEGPRALYRGYVPKVLRLGPGGGIMIVGFEFFARLLE